MLYSHLHHHSGSQRHNIKDRRMNKRRMIKTQEDFFTNILPLTLLQGLKGLFKGLHVRGCWRPNVNFIFWPHCYDRHVVSLLFSWCWGLLHRGFPRAPSVWCGLPYHIWSLLSGSLLATASGVSEVPLGRVWPFLPHLVSNPLGVCWQLYRGFPRSPSVGCGLPYHISSLTLWESAGNCSGTQTQLS